MNQTRQEKWTYRDMWTQTLIESKQQEKYCMVVLWLINRVGNTGSGKSEWGLFLSPESVSENGFRSYLKEIPFWYDGEGYEHWMENEPVFGEVHWRGSLESPMRSRGITWLRRWRIVCIPTEWKKTKTRTENITLRLWFIVKSMRLKNEHTSCLT